ncbi:uncharacterized protein LOC123439750 [Hordeum vulgare subsp. vulgare]|uniref:uncharacterized protein LOC123439750 n=1 Tax=Hordeum vulgare subsp. vulgare TaxID=112509 RepID=UPI001D1A4E50|nr:uncharacterized protein LOC123439750 [Hordeum vulgare subsp. vulgare]
MTSKPFRKIISQRSVLVRLRLSFSLEQGERLPLDRGRTATRRIKAAMLEEEEHTDLLFRRVPSPISIHVYFLNILSQFVNQVLLILERIKTKPLWLSGCRSSSTMFVACSCSPAVEMALSDGVNSRLLRLGRRALPCVRAPRCRVCLLLNDRGVLLQMSMG